jgi:NADH dehydrogenase FAD-containing subunit
MIDYHRKIQEAKSILVVGSGVVGVQLVGELAVEYAQKGLKKVALLSRSTKLLNTLPTKAGKLADKFLREHNVQVMYNTNYDEKDRDRFSYDLVIKCIGYKFKTDFLKKNYPSCLAANGQIYVNDLMQLSGIDPLDDPLVPGVKPNIYVLGDNC